MAEFEQNMCGTQRITLKLTKFLPTPPPHHNYQPLPYLAEV